MRKKITKKSMIISNTLSISSKAGKILLEKACLHEADRLAEFHQVKYINPRTLQVLPELVALMLPPLVEANSLYQKVPLDSQKRNN